jgi:hypothetical protein
MDSSFKKIRKILHKSDWFLLTAEHENMEKDNLKMAFGHLLAYRTGLPLRDALQNENYAELCMHLLEPCSLHTHSVV